jgi:hypothetical protein
VRRVQSKLLDSERGLVVSQNPPDKVFHVDAALVRLRWINTLDERECFALT